MNYFKLTKFYILLFALALLTNVNNYAQENIILKTWSNKDLAYLKLDEKRVYFEMYGHYQHQKPYAIIKDTLRLYDKYTSSRDNYSKQHIDNFDFLIKKLTLNKLIIAPLNSHAKGISNGKKKLKYIARKNVIDRNLQFKQLRYRVYGFAWKWHDVSFLIDDKGNFKYVDKNEKNKHGYYTGILSEDQFYTFISLLKSNEIDKLKNFEQIVSDIPETILEIDYNGKSKQIRQYILPAITTDLINFIQELPKKVPLTKTDAFQINFHSK